MKPLDGCLNRLSLRVTTLLGVLLGVVAVAGGTAQAGDAPLPKPVTHEHFNFFQGAVTQQGDGTASSAQYKNPPSPICSTVPASSPSNVNTDCEGTAPHNETSVAVNPTNRLNMVGSANDYQLAASGGGTFNETAYSRAHVTFDGGKSWTTYPISYSGYIATGDPAVAFDAHGTVYLATLGFVWSQGGPTGTNADILVAHSTDGGKTWSTPSKVATGSGSWGSPGVFNDKESIAAWGNGNAIVTWTRFDQGQAGSYIDSPISASVTHDGGQTWSAPRIISGAAAFCTGALSGTTCDQDQGSVPTVAADGSIYVSFLNYAAGVNVTNANDQYLVVKVDPITGGAVSGPSRVGAVVDATNDYPISAFGDTTYQDSQFRTWAFGAITADPTNAQHLAVAWSDMRNSPRPANPDPYQATTNSDIIVSQSFDGGATWSAPAAIKKPGDQFMPWDAVTSDGALQIGYFDRSYDAANHQYGYTLATETAGAKTFSFTRVASVLSDPTQGDRWFSGTTVNTAFPHPTSFLGDYSGIAASGTSVAALWTDMRVSVCLGTRCGHGEDTFVSQVP
jgi:BNR/Asp-box repeat